MDIQWVIMAKSMKLNPNRSIDIGEIVNHCNICGEANSFPIMLVAKANFSPIETGENKTLTLKLIHGKNGEVLSEDIPYKVPDLITWADSVTYLKIAIKLVRFQYSGIYTFKLLVDGIYKNEESIEVTDLMEKFNENN